VSLCGSFSFSLALRGLLGRSLSGDRSLSLSSRGGFLLRLNLRFQLGQFSLGFLARLAGPLKFVVALPSGGIRWNRC
jgi:hypothetical protein